ncbi:hypothetical protein M2138_000267 [Dysgonomonadaceae bacterium PH5-43]|nr:hypothetical protein [Dysgonomonadaceae bacterium PH5-43]
MKQPKRTSRKVSEATRQKMSLAKKGSKNPRYRQRVSDETRRKISQSMKAYWHGIPEQ